MWPGLKLTSLSDSLFKSLFRLLFRYDIFISYARGDGKDYAIKLRDQLQQLDFSCFLDFDELPPGNSLNNTLKRAIRNSATLVVVGTERAIKSRYVELEVGEFANTGRAIIPIDIEGTLAETPWRVIKERDIVWIDEIKTALAKGVPSPTVADSIDKLFKYTRRNSRVRAQVLFTIILFVVVVAASIFLIRQQVSAATRASAEAKTASAEAKIASAKAEEEKRIADDATKTAELEKANAKRDREKATTAEIAAVAAAKNAKEQERIALINAEKAKAEQARAEERTQYVRAEQIGVQADIDIDKGDDLDRSVLLSVESLKTALTPEGYIGWARGMELLPHAAKVNFAEQQDNVSSIAYSPDGRFFAYGTTEGTVTLFPTGKTGEPVKRLSPLKTEVKVIAFGDDGNWVAAASTSELRVWDLNTLEPTKSLDNFAAESIAFSPDGRYVAMANRDPQAQVLRVADWNVVARPSSEQFVMCVAFSPDSRWLVTGIRAGKLAMWDVTTFNGGDNTLLKPVAQASAGATIYTVAFSPKGRYLASDDSYGVVDLWYVSTGNDRNTPELSKLTPEQQIKSLSNGQSPLVFSPDESYIATSQRSSLSTGGFSNTAQILEVKTGLENARIGLGSKGINAIAFSPDGQLLATAAGVVDFFKAQYGSDTTRLNHTGPVHSLDVSPNGQWLVTASADGARVFQTTNWSPVSTPGGAGDVSSAVFSSDSRWLATLRQDKVEVFDTTHWTLQKEMAHRGGVSRIGFSPDSRWLITTEPNSILRLIEVRSWREFHVMKHSDPIQGVAFSPDGSWLAVRTKEQYRMHHKGAFREEMYVWDMKSGLPVTCITDTGKPLLSANGSTQSSADVKEVVCSDVRADGREALLAEARAWKESLKIERSSDASYDGRWVAENANKGVILNFKEGNIVRQVAQLMKNTSVTVTDLTFTPDSRWLVTAEDHIVKLWPLKAADMISAACERLRRRNLTLDEWKQHFSGEKLQPTCVPALP